MNKVITINLGGIAYQLEEGGYDTLRAYLETAASRLQGNPDRDEILSDIERAIGEKFGALLGSHKTVVETKEVDAVLAAMGPIEADSGQAPDEGASRPGASSATGRADTAKPEQPAGGNWAPRRLYRISEGEMVAGVCNGIGAYLNIDPTFIRLAFVISVIFFGTGFLVYFILMLVIPEAVSPEQKAEATGSPPTAQEYIRRAKQGYYEAMKGFPDRKARREWRRRFRSEMRNWRWNFDNQMRGPMQPWNQDWWKFGWWHSDVPRRVSPTLPLISILQGLLVLVLGCALFSILGNGDLFGHDLPSNVPVWLAVVLVLLAYGVVSWPLKMARRACYWGAGQSSHATPFVLLADSIVWLAVIGVVAWLAFHYMPELNTAAQVVPSLFHQAVHDIKHWWRS